MRAIATDAGRSLGVAYRYTKEGRTPRRCPRPHVGADCSEGEAKWHLDRLRSTARLRGPHVHAGDCQQPDEPVQLAVCLIKGRRRLVQHLVTDVPVHGHRERLGGVTKRLRYDGGMHTSLHQGGRKGVTEVVESSLGDAKPLGEPLRSRRPRVKSGFDLASLDADGDDSPFTWWP